MDKQVIRKRDKRGRFVKNENGDINSNDLAEVDITTIRDRLLMNVFMGRSAFISQMLDPRRDIYGEAGYPKYKMLTIDDYKQMYDREPIGARVVEIFPEECWMVTPKVSEAKEDTENSPFEEAIQKISNVLSGDEWYKSDIGSPIWSYLKKIDILSGIGSFGVLLLGINDGKELFEEAVFNPSESAEMELNYIRVFDESQILITKWEEDNTNPRVGLPTEYTIQIHDESVRQRTGARLDTQTHKVHWTRVIHVAETKGSSESFAKPRQEQVYNRLHDLVKLYGGQAEMYWRGAFPGLSVESHPSLGGDVDIDKKEVVEQIDKMQNGLTRWLAIMGASVKSLAPQVVSPKEHIDVAIEAICIKLGCPVRIFKGSERGELASSQDDSSWNDTLANRHNTYLTPELVSPFFSRLIKLNVLPEPKDGYKIEWPDLNALDEKTKAEIAMKRTQALAAYVNGDIATVMSVEDYMIKELGYTKDEVTEIQKRIDKELLALLKQEEQHECDHEHFLDEEEKEENEENENEE